MNKIRIKLFHLVESPDDTNEENSSLDWYDVLILREII